MSTVEMIKAWIQRLIPAVLAALSFTGAAWALPDLDVSLDECQQRRDAAAATAGAQVAGTEQDQQQAEQWQQAFNQIIPARAREHGQPADDFFLASYDHDDLNAAIGALKRALAQQPDEPLYLYMTSLLCERQTPPGEFCQGDHIGKAAQGSDNGFYAAQAALQAYRNKQLDQARDYLAAAASSNYYQSVYGQVSAVYYQVISEHSRDLAWLTEELRVVTALSLAMSQTVPALQSLVEMCLPERHPLNPDNSDCLHLAQLMTTDRSSLVEANIGFVIWRGILDADGKRPPANENQKLQRQIGKVMQLSRRSAAMSCARETAHQDSPVGVEYLNDLAALGEIAAIAKQLDEFEAVSH